ncbi:MAG: hypothetical protein FWF33_08160 [Clostridiales bacterium]|nr:hypothetical protein [Clostridiales bacterium]
MQFPTQFTVIPAKGGLSPSAIFMQLSMQFAVIPAKGGLPPSAIFMQLSMQFPTQFTVIPAKGGLPPPQFLCNFSCNFPRNLLSYPQKADCPPPQFFDIAPAVARRCLFRDVHEYFIIYGKYRLTRDFECCNIIPLYRNKFHEAVVRELLYEKVR